MARFSLTISRLGGLPIRMHWSWLAVSVALIALLFQIYHTYADVAVASLVALAAVGLFLLSVLLHELAHALAARGYRLRVGSITLFGFGGVTEITDDPSHPGQELLLALAGPLVSLLLTIIFFAGWKYSTTPLASLLTFHLGMTNALIVAINMLPSYPLDGGRFLRAILWFLTEEELSAAHLVWQIGRASGWALIVLGALYLFTSSDIFYGLWVCLIGYFALRTAHYGYRQLVLRRALSGVAVADVMQRGYRAVDPAMRLDHFVGRFVLGQIDQGFPVLLQPEADGPQPLLGMITVRHLRRFELSRWAYMQVGEVMTPAASVRVVPPDMSAGEAFRLLLESGDEQVPVTDGSTLLGILRRRDLVHYIQLRLKQPGR